MAKKKIFVLDTNILIHDPESFTKYGKDPVYTSFTSINELDHMKSEKSYRGQGARAAFRKIEAIITKSKQCLNDGVVVNKEGGKLHILTPPTEEMNKILKKRGIEDPIPDDKIIAFALNLFNKHGKNRQVQIVTKDRGVVARANILSGRPDFTTDYTFDVVKGIYEGITTVELDNAEEIKDEIYKTREIDSAMIPKLPELSPNQFVHIRFRQPDNGKLHELIMISKRDKLILVNHTNSDYQGIKPRNLRQRAAMHLLLDPDIKLVTILGKAGTGKTLLVLAAGLYQYNQPYDKVIVGRPIITMGKDLGSLPGKMEEKLSPYMRPIFDNLDFLLNLDNKKNNKKMGRSYSELNKKGIIDIEPLSYIRGRSISDQYFIIDEAQNLTPREVKTIVTRAGEGTKIIFTGDPHQIDNNYLSWRSNGVSYLAEKFKDQGIAGHILLTEGERSDLAEIGSNIL